MSVVTEVKAEDQNLGHHLEGLPTEFIEALGQAETMGHELERDELISFLSNTYPNIFEAIVGAQGQVSDRGFALIDTGLGEANASEIPAVALAISALLGRPTETDKASRSIIWPVTPRSTEYSVTTFSEDVGEAAMHTDSQFIEHPEDMFLLACVHSDLPGRGTSELLDSSVLRSIVKAQNTSFYEALQKTYPFRVPTVFTEHLTDDIPEVIWRPIIEEDRIRYRFDTVMNALALEGVDIPAIQLAAFRYFSKLIATMPRVNRHLTPGQVMLVDNRRMLHARTDFSDRARLLLRVRMNK